MELKNKIVIITGASGGIGEATAKLLGSQGAKVALVARSEEKLKQLAQKLPEAFAVKADMSKENEVRNMVELVKNHFGRVDILINNAGQGYGSPIEMIDLKKFRYVFDLNVIGPLVAMQSVIPIMKEQGSGLILNISSATSVMYLPNLAAYSATKRALNGITLTARAELEKDNIKVCLLHPYITATDFYKNSLTSSTGAPGHMQSNPKMPPPDSAEFVAEKILELIKSEAAEMFVHDWMTQSA